MIKKNVYNSPINVLNESFNREIITTKHGKMHLHLSKKCLWIQISITPMNWIKVWLQQYIFNSFLFSFVLFLFFIYSLITVCKCVWILSCAWQLLTVRVLLFQVYSVGRHLIYTCYTYKCQMQDLQCDTI